MGERAIQYSPTVTFLHVGNLEESSKNLTADEPECGPPLEPDFTIEERISFLDDMALVIDDESEFDDSDDEE